MNDPTLLEVTPALRVRRRELRFRTSRAGGPGGQHVNTTDSRVELRWDVARSPSLSAPQRARLLDRLASRLDAAGVLRLTASARRSQLRNKEEAVARLVTLVAAALRPRAARTPTAPTRASRERRLEAKRRRGATKRERRTRDDDA